MAEAKIPLRERRKLVRSFRKQTGLTLEALGELAGLSFAMVAKFENGTRNLSDEAWSRVLDAMETFLRTRNAEIAAQTAKARETATKLGATVPLGLGIMSNDYFAKYGIDEREVSVEGVETYEQQNERLEQELADAVTRDARYKNLVTRVENVLPRHWLDHPDVQELMSLVRSSHQREIDAKQRELDALKALQARDSEGRRR